MKRLLKKAFSLAEVLTVLSIIGVLSLITLRSVVNRNPDYNKLYYIAYDTLLQTVGNAALAWAPEEHRCDAALPVAAGGAPTVGIYGYYWSDDCWSRYIATGIESDPSLGGVPGFPRQYGGFLYGTPEAGRFDGGEDNDIAFCRNLTRNINTINSDIECRSFISGMRPETDFTVGQNFEEAFCALQKEEDSDREVCAGTAGIDPSFIAANGQKFYISTLLTMNPPSIQFPDGAEANRRLMFRFIAVDINGDSGPNTQLRKGARKPDIVLFAVNNEGAVIPLGRPEFDKDYLVAKVLYPRFLNEVDPTNPTRFKPNPILESDGVTLYDAKAMAFGRGAAGGQYTDQNFILSQPFSFSTMFYAVATQCVQAECSGRTLANGSTRVYADDLLVKLIRQFMLDQSMRNEDVVPIEFGDARVDGEHGCTLDDSKCMVEVTKL